ncbi:MAG: beta-ketoacyl-ACP synthase III [Chloroflexota bacterium]
MRFAHITGWGMATPDKIITNSDLESRIDTTDQWIVERTGISQRRIAREGETTASLGELAAWRALSIANLRPMDLDLIICATSSPEYLFPATACIIQDRLGAKKAGAFDLSAACSGFIFAVNMATQAIRTESIRSALVIGAETLSRLTDWNDRNTCILFGDGAGAIVLQASDMPGGVLSAVMHADGSGADLLLVPGGGSRHPTSAETVRAGMHYIKMDGREVFRFATRAMANATKEALRAANLKANEISWVIPHQANLRIIEAAAKNMKIPFDRFIINIDRYGNTSTASIPIALCEAVTAGKFALGDKLIFVGFGAGLTWGALVAEWTGPLASDRKVRPVLYQFWARIHSIFMRIIRFVEGLIWGNRG